jgi:hypothetical protein
MTRRTSRSSARESQQSLSNVEETIFIQCIIRLIHVGYLASPKLVIEIAEEVRRERVQLSYTVSFSFQFR